MIRSEPRAADFPGLPLLRVVPGTETRLKVCSPLPVWLATHWHRRAYICVGDDCPLCSHLSQRELLYVVVQLTDKLQGNCIYLLELPHAAGAALTGFREHAGSESLTGLEICAFRRKKRGPINLVFDGTSDLFMPGSSSLTLLGRSVAKLYRLPSPFDGESLEGWGLRTVPVARSAALVASRDFD